MANLWSNRLGRGCFRSDGPSPPASGLLHAVDTALSPGALATAKVRRSIVRSMDLYDIVHAQCSGVAVSRLGCVCKKLGQASCSAPARPPGFLKFSQSNSRRTKRSRMSVAELSPSTLERRHDGKGCRVHSGLQLDRELVLWLYAADRRIRRPASWPAFE